MTDTRLAQIVIKMKCMLFGERQKGYSYQKGEKKKIDS